MKAYYCSTCGVFVNHVQKSNYHQGHAVFEEPKVNLDPHKRTTQRVSVISDDNCCPTKQKIQELKLLWDKINIESYSYRGSNFFRITGIKKK